MDNEDTNAIPQLDEFEKQELATADDPDFAVNEKLNWAKENGKESAEKIEKRVKEHHEFFDGDQIKYQIPQYMSDSVFNYVFPGVVNIVGLLTDASFEPQVHPQPSEDPEAIDKNKKKALGWERALVCLWQNKDIPEKMVTALYKFIIEEDVIFVPNWGYEDDDVNVDITSIVGWRFPASSASIEAAPWAIRESEKDWNFFVDNFEDKLPVIKEALKAKNKGKNNEGKFKIEEYFTAHTYIMRIADVILKKIPNPYFEFRDEEEQKDEWIKDGNNEKDFKPVKNYFKRPRKPIISLSAYNTGEIYSRSRMQQLKKPQIDLNKRIQQIDDNLTLGASGIWIYDTMFVSEDEMDKVTFEPFQKIGVLGGKTSLHRESGEGVPAGVFDNVLQTQRGFDDIFGYHEVSRGSKVRTSTFGEAALLKEADQTSIRLLSRSYQATLQKLMEFWVQLMSLYYTVEHHFQWQDAAGVDQFLALTREDVTPGMHITIKVGAQLSKDKAQKQEEIAMLAQAGAADPLTMYESMGYQSPLKLANRLANWKKLGVISDEQLPAEGQAGESTGQPNEQIIRQQAALADEENQRMAQGEPVSINEDDIDEVHLDLHLKFENITQLHEAHIADHQERGGTPSAVPGGEIS